MTFDDIRMSSDLFDGVWDTQRFTNALEDAVSVSTLKKTERLLTGKGLVFKAISEDTATDEEGRQTKAVVLSSILGRAKAKRHRMLFMANYESDGLHYIGLNDGRSVRQWIFKKNAIV